MCAMSFNWIQNTSVSDSGHLNTFCDIFLLMSEVVMVLLYVCVCVCMCVFCCCSEKTFSVLTIQMAVIKELAFSKHIFVKQEKI